MKPSLEALEILAISDRPAFEDVMEQIGLHVVGLVDVDPLRSNVQSEQIVSIASALSEDVNDQIMVNPGIGAIKAMAEDYGYIVSYA